jgi:uncharacterized Zn-binding protein involved in type VI secretion
MPAAARLNDTDTVPSTIASAVASTVFINGKPAAVVGSQDTTPSPITQGSSTVNIENKAAARIGDPVANGSTVNSGSPNVVIGG